MKSYVFLTNSMGGYSGGPTYVRNKKLFLKEKGWNVTVFDSTGMSNAKIVIETLKRYESNRYKELFYYPQLLRKSRREHVISEIIEKIGKSENIVIESNTPALSLWGEMIAQRIGAKHIIYLLSEKLSLTNKNLYDFFKYKTSRAELYSISPNAYKKLFCNFEDAIDADSHYWSAGIVVPIEDVACDELSSVKEANFNIGHFGRYKNYFKYMFQNVAAFAKLHQNESINFILLGVDSLSNELQDILPMNVCLIMVPSRQPIPRRFFEIADVVIATAGCAIISYRHGAKVIAMDVYNNNPLGVLGYDTSDSNIRSVNNHYSLSLHKTLENVLLQKKYDGLPVLEIQKSNKGFDYQLSFSTVSDGQYFNVENAFIPHKGIVPFLLKCNMVNICSKYRHYKFR